MNERQCPYCGRLLLPDATTCPFCHETLLEAGHHSVHFRSAAGATQIRRGLLYILLAGVLYYFAGGYSTFALPSNITWLLTQWALPLLFLGGLGLAIYGVYCRITG
ncbi:MAG: hypothetical protein ACRD35_01260 [Candidatus Acidiferrales bacterium]